jgi:hypothetical protein
MYSHFHDQRYPSPLDATDQRCAARSAGHIGHRTASAHQCGAIARRSTGRYRARRTRVSAACNCPRKVDSDGLTNLSPEDAGRAHRFEKTGQPQPASAPSPEPASQFSTFAQQVRSDTCPAAMRKRRGQIYVAKGQSGDAVARGATPELCHCLCTGAGAVVATRHLGKRIYARVSNKEPRHSVRPPAAANATV